MNAILNLQNIKENNLDLYNKLIEYDCAIFYNHKCVYEGKYNENIKLDNIDESIIIFSANDSNILMTLTENESLNKIIGMLANYGYENIMEDYKLYNSIVNLSNNIPQFPTIYEGNNLEIICMLLEDDSIPGDGLPNKKEKQDEKSLKRKSDIKFTIWEKPDKKLKWLENNTGYQKIEYIYNNKNKGLNIDFLLGFVNGTWKLWVGKLGAISYDDDPYVDLKENKFEKAIISALDKIDELILDIEENPNDWPQFYINI